MVDAAVFVGETTLFDPILFALLLQVSIECVTFAIVSVDVERGTHAGIFDVLGCSELVCLARPYFSPLAALLRNRRGRCIGSGRKYSTQFCNSFFNHVVGNIIVFELNTQFHALHFDFAFAFVFQDGSVRLCVSYMFRGRCFLVKRRITWSKVGDVALYIAVRTRSSRCFQADTVIHDDDRMMVVRRKEVI